MTAPAIVYDQVAYASGQKHPYYNGCFDIMNKTEREVNPKAKTCHKNAVWAKTTGVKEEKDYYTHYPTLSTDDGLEKYQCMLWKKSTLPPYTNKESHYCIYPCANITIEYKGVSGKSEMLCGGKDAVCEWTDWSSCSFSGPDAGRETTFRTRQVKNGCRGWALNVNGSAVEIEAGCTIGKPFLDLWAILLLAALVCGVIVAIVYFLCCQRKRRTVKPKKEKIVLKETITEEVKQPAPIPTTSMVMPVYQPPVTTSMVVAPPVYQQVSVVQPQTVMQPVTRTVQKQVPRIVYDTVEEIETVMQPETVMTTVQAPATASYHPGYAGSYVR
jgi:hypothetical protein